MSGASLLSAAQLADVVARARDGRRDITAMTNAERTAAGLMTRRQAAEHERLATLPHVRLAERVRGPLPDDIWVTPLPGDPPEYRPAEDDADWDSYLEAPEAA